MAIGQALGGIVGGILGGNAAKMDRRHQKEAMQQALALYDQIGLPPDTSKALILQELERQGIYTPQLEEDLSSMIAESEVGKIQEAPELRQAQLQALASMQQLSKVGLGAEDRAALNQVRQQVQRDAEAKRQQVLQQMQARGMGGSGAALIAQLQAGQEGAELASQQSDSLMAQAQQRALQALGQSAGLAGQVRGQEFDIAQSRARAIDERNRFLAENSIARQQRNVGALNQAQLANLQEQQRIADYNAQLANQEQQRQAEAQRQTYDQKLKFGALKSGQLGQMSDFYGQQAQAKAQASKDMGAGIGGLVDFGVGSAFGTPAAGAGSSGYGELFKKITG